MIKLKLYGARVTVPAETRIEHGFNGVLPGCASWKFRLFESVVYINASSDASTSVLRVSGHGKNWRLKAFSQRKDAIQYAAKWLRARSRKK